MRAMPNNRERASLRWLDPIDRVSEILFGLIMVLTSTSTLSVVTAGRADVKTMILGALGCNLAWGIIDAGLYLMGCLGERGRGLLKLRTLRQTSDPDAGRRTLADALPAPLVSVLSRDELELMRQRLIKLPDVAAARRPDKRRMARRPGHLPARVSFRPFRSSFRSCSLTSYGQRSGFPTPSRSRCCSCAATCSRETTGLRPWPTGLVMVADWRCHGGNCDRARRLSRAEC